MKFSIITPSFNSAQTIRRAIESVLLQRYEHFEHIVIDGGSSDGTIEILEQYPHLNWISEPDRGMVDAMHKGFARSTGQIIGNLNSDDYYLPGAFDTVARYFVEGKDFVMGRIQVVSEVAGTTWLNDPATDLHSMLKHWQHNAFCVNPVGYFYRRAVQETIPFNIDNEDKQDLEFLLEVASKYTITKIDTLLGVFVNSADTKTGRAMVLPSYWRNDNFPFVDRLLDRTDTQYQRRFRLDRERGYQLRRLWTIHEAFRSGAGETLLQQAEFLFLPGNDSQAEENRCHFIDFDKLACPRDWITAVFAPEPAGGDLVYQTLRSLPLEVFPSPTYFVPAMLAQPSVDQPEIALRAPASFHLGHALNTVLKNHRSTFCWKFIVAVRDPISAGIAAVVANGQDNGTDMFQEVLNHSRSFMSFFDDQFRAGIGIELYDFPFEWNNGYSIIEKDEIAVLVYRFEDLRRIFAHAAKEYIGVPNLVLNWPLSEQEDFSNRCEHVRSALNIPTESLDEIYASRYMNHFYTPEEIRRFRRVWSKCDIDFRKEEFGIVYDIGMHEGQDTAFYLAKGFRVVAIDANPLLVERARGRFEKEIAAGQLVILNIGIGPESTSDELAFYVNDRNTEWSSFFKEIAERDGSAARVLRVPCRPLAEIVEEFGAPYYVKIDIEGYDHIALESLLRGQALPRYVSVENGNIGALQLLSEADYTGFKYIQQNNISQLPLPWPALEGRFVAHTFPFDASGPFGEETPGRWESHDDVRRMIESVWDPDGCTKNPDHDDAIDGWFNLHAKLSTRQNRTRTS